MTRFPTNYKAQRNRCVSCGHRRNMHQDDCRVITGYGNDPANDKPCDCKRDARFGKW